MDVKAAILLAYILVGKYDNPVNSHIIIPIQVEEAGWIAGAPRFIEVVFISAKLVVNGNLQTDWKADSVDGQPVPSDLAEELMIDRWRE